MDLPTIGRRLADELRSPDIRAAGLRQAYYPAPSSFAESPAALIFAQAFTITPMGGEETWEGEVAVQLMIAAQGRLAAEINALEPLIEPIVEHFRPGTAANALSVPGDTDTPVHKCYPHRFEPSQTIEFAGHVYTGVTIYFDIKFHRQWG
jgi:hypothetical protein